MATTKKAAGATKAPVAKKAPAVKVPAAKKAPAAKKPAAAKAHAAEELAVAVKDEGDTTNAELLAKVETNATKLAKVEDATRKQKRCAMGFVVWDDATGLCRRCLIAARSECAGV